ncbi:MAG: hypothetical protein CMQ05_13430 [Gammaproteobacteria bacterium]|nr:hypothetical protein [Gammaproteobacteria bacterium]RPG27001.1 MAG: hypothetical protein CBC10_002460 [Gammaproteobacteria bacterium TMED50]
MRQILRTLFSPLLKLVEDDQDQSYVYKRSHRTILVVMSLMFIALASFVFYLIPEGRYDYLLPVIVFGSAGVFGLIVAAVATDQGVARLWRSR